MFTLPIDFGRLNLPIETKFYKNNMSVVYEEAQTANFGRTNLPNLWGL